VKRLNQRRPPLEFLRTDPCQSRIRTLGNTEKEKIIKVPYSFLTIYHKKHKSDNHLPLERR